MTQEIKLGIVDRLAQYVERKGSINKAARSLQGVSSATISKMLSGKTEDISDDMWRSVSSKIATTDQSGWQLAETRAYGRMTFLLQQAQADSLVVAVTGDAGCGKTEAMRRYADEGSNVYHIVCSEFLNRRSFSTKLLKALGRDTSAQTVSEMIDEIIDTLSRQERPLLILDEADKLTDQVLYFFISIYNALEWRCGIVLCATSYLERRLARGLRLGKRGYAEIWSRVGRRCIPLQTINEEDVQAVCLANGVTDERTIEQICRDSEYDLRRVKRAVYVVLKSETA